MPVRISLPTVASLHELGVLRMHLAGDPREMVVPKEEERLWRFVLLCDGRSSTMIASFRDYVVSLPLLRGPRRG